MTWMVVAIVTSRQYGVYVAIEISCTLLKEGEKKTSRSMQTLHEGNVFHNHFTSSILVFTYNEKIISNSIQPVGCFVVINVFLTEISLLKA